MDPLSRYLRPRPRSAAVLWLGAMLLCAASVWGATIVYRQHGLIGQQKDVLFKMQKSSRVIVSVKPSRAEEEARLQWATLKQELNYSWYPIFAALEHTSNENIALLEFIPDKASTSLALHGTARNVNALTDYLEALHHEVAFKDVYLSHQKNIQQGSINILEFEIRIKIR